MSKAMPIVMMNKGGAEHKTKVNRDSTENKANNKANSLNNKVTSKHKVVQKMSRIKNNYMSS